MLNDSATSENFIAEAERIKNEWDSLNIDWDNIEGHATNGQLCANAAALMMEATIDAEEEYNEHLRNNTFN